MLLINDDLIKLFNLIDFSHNYFLLIYFSRHLQDIVNVGNMSTIDIFKSGVDDFSYFFINFQLFLFSNHSNLYWFIMPKIIPINHFFFKMRQLYGRKIK